MYSSFLIVVLITFTSNFNKFHLKIITILKISKYGESMQALPLGYNAGYLY